MAIVMVLIAAVGWLFVPQAPQRPEATGGTVVDPSHEAEAAHLAALQPATPLDLAVDVRTGRIRAKGDKDDAPHTPGEQPPMSADSLPPGSPASNQGDPPTPSSATPATRDAGVAAIPRAGHDAGPGPKQPPEPPGPQIGRGISTP